MDISLTKLRKERKFFLLGAAVLLGTMFLPIIGLMTVLTTSKETEYDYKTPILLVTMFIYSIGSIGFVYLALRLSRFLEYPTWERIFLSIHAFVSSLFGFGFLFFIFPFTELLVSMKSHKKSLEMLSSKHADLSESLEQKKEYIDSDTVYAIKSNSKGYQKNTFARMLLGVLGALLLFFGVLFLVKGLSQFHPILVSISDFTAFGIFLMYVASILLYYCFKKKTSLLIEQKEDSQTHNGMGQQADIGESS